MPDNANQKVIHVNNEMKLEKGKFTSLDNDAYMKAAQLLNHGVGFSLYVYFCGNADGNNRNIYAVDIMNKLGMAKSSYHNAKNDLIDYGFLIKSPTDSYGYEFFTHTPISDKLLQYIPKTRSKRGKDELELQRKYFELMNSGKDIEDYD